MGSTLILLGTPGLSTKPIKHVELFDLVQSEEVINIGSQGTASLYSSIDQAALFLEDEPFDTEPWLIAKYKGIDGETGLNLTRPSSWFESHGNSEGALTYISLPDIGLADSFLLEQIYPASIEQRSKLTSKGAIQPITATVSHYVPIILQLATSSDTIEVTPEHPFYSLDRLNWVPVGDLLAGENLKTYGGRTKVIGINVPRASNTEVFNLEVHTNHNYFVGEERILVHNTCDLEFVKAVWDSDASGSVIYRQRPGSITSTEVDELATFLKQLPLEKRTVLENDLVSLPAGVQSQIVQRIKEWEVMFSSTVFRTSTDDLTTIGKYLEFNPNKANEIKQQFDNIASVPKKRVFLTDHAEYNRAKQVKQSDRVNELSIDPSNPTQPDLYEGEVGQIIESNYGYFKRDPSGNGDFIGLTGLERGKVIDVFGIPSSAIQYHGNDLANFLPSVDQHFYKVQSGSVQILEVDVRAMNNIQLQNLQNYVSDNWLELSSILKYIQ